MTTPEMPDAEPTPEVMAPDDAIRATVARLARRHPSGGAVIERAAILAEGPDGSAIVAWIIDHHGEPEGPAPAAAGRGLHSARVTDSIGTGQRAPLRYVLPAGALD